MPSCRKLPCSRGHTTATNNTTTSNPNNDQSTSTSTSSQETTPLMHKVLKIDETCSYLHETLTIFVVGASGDLAKKKTYPSLFDLYRHGFLPENVTICGYARSVKSDGEFRAHVRPFLEKKNGDGDVSEQQQQQQQREEFLSKCIYRNGAYDSPDDIGLVFEELKEMEEEGAGEGGVVNRLFYFAIPPSVFVPIGTSLKQAVIGPSEELSEEEGGGSRYGWNRLIIEKPFGRDSESFEALGDAMSALYSEDHIYRIDHYLGKEMVNNLTVLRFGNAIFEPLWNKTHISNVQITFKEDFGTKGRGGYFDKYGIIRDIIQNHLLQVLSLVAMEPPTTVSGPNHSNHVRNAKVAVLQSISPPTLDDCVLGQYLAPSDNSEPAYVDDPTVPDDSVTPTFAAVVLKINNPRWEGVPFVLKAGKALDQRRCDIRIQFKPPPAAAAMFGGGGEVARNELVMRLQPNEAVYTKLNVKEPGLRTAPVTTALDLTYKSEFPDAVLFDAYTRLMLDTLRGSQAHFVRDDELRAAWKIFTPLLHKIERERVKPIAYEYGSRGPVEADELLKRNGFVYNPNYKWSGNKIPASS